MEYVLMIGLSIFLVYLLNVCMRAYIDEKEFDFKFRFEKEDKIYYIVSILWSVLFSLYYYWNFVDLFTYGSIRF